jgi:NADPH:quinone reductase-like Zn-dependent oxidoreductase
MFRSPAEYSLRRMGVRVIVTPLSDPTLDLARALVADDTITYRMTSDWSVRAHALTSGIGVCVYVVLDLVTKISLTSCLKPRVGFRRHDRRAGRLVNAALGTGGAPQKPVHLRHLRR